jgi:hypothetical protein
LLFLQSDVHENQPFPDEGLSDGVKRLKPDMFFERRTNRGQVLEILEFSCPYGYVSHERNTLEAVYDLKNTKYKRLAEELRTLRHEPVTVTVVIVSSMGAVYAPSLKLLHTILRCSDGDTRALGKRMSDAALAGSLKIWFEIMRNSEQGATYGEEGDALVAQESEAANAPEIVNGGGKEDEEDEAEHEDEQERREEERRHQEGEEEQDGRERRVREVAGDERFDRHVALPESPADDEATEEWLSE